MQLGAKKSPEQGSKRTTSARDASSDLERPASPPRGAGRRETGVEAAAAGLCQLAALDDETTSPLPRNGRYCD